MIDSFRFGQIKVSGVPYRKDLKIILDTVYPNWRRGEGHKLYSKDIEDILNSQVEILVVGAGTVSGMKIMDEVYHAAGKQNIELVALPTDKAVSAFNEFLLQGRKVAGAFHITC